jgi:hypothetical protein
LSCEQNPNGRRRRAHRNPRTSARNHRRTVSDSGSPSVASAPPRSSSHTRSPSPTEGFSVPADLQCPITGTLFCDPVVASDGHTYERTAITTWIAQAGKSPVTRDKLTPGSLHPNRIIKKQVDDFRVECQRKKLLYPYKIDIHVKKTEELPYITTKNISIYRAEWIKSPHHSNIILIHLTGDLAEKLAEMMCRLELNRNIVRVYGRVEHTDEGILLIQEETPTKTLSELITNNDPKLSLQVRDIIAYQSASALQHLADAGITHRHLTPNNVLIYHLDDTPENTLIKLTNLEETENSTDNIDISYTAPEVLSDHLYSEKSDVYAFGKLALEMYSLVLTTNNDEESSERQDLFERCIEIDPNDRPTFNELIIAINHLINRETSSE